MNEKDLSRALLHHEPLPDIAALTQQVIRRDRRRVLLAAVGCVAAWMLVVMLPWATVLPLVARITQSVTAPDAGLPTSGPATLDHHRELMDLASSIQWATMATFFASIASMLLAAVCTVAFIFLSRRATLRQVNAQLSSISASLKAMSSGGAS